jgi:hypothetical protein
LALVIVVALFIANRSKITFDSSCMIEGDETSSQDIFLSGFFRIVSDLDKPTFGGEIID